MSNATAAKISRKPNSAASASAVVDAPPCGGQTGGGSSPGGTTQNGGCSSRRNSHAAHAKPPAPNEVERLDLLAAGRGVGEWQTTSTVIELEPGRRWAYAVGDPDHPAATWRWTLDPLPGGGTRLGLQAQLGPGPSGLTPAIAAMPHKERRIVARRLRDLRTNMERTCHGIRTLVEPD